MICNNPECKGSFYPGCGKEKYCCPKCRTRAKTIRETARKRAASAISTHPCKRCGGPAPYKKLYCEACKAEIEKPSGPGVGPLNTSRIKACRARELERIELVVAKAQAGGGPKNMFRTNKTSWHGVKVG